MNAFQFLIYTTNGKRRTIGNAIIYPNDYKNMEQGQTLPVTLGQVQQEIATLTERLVEMPDILSIERVEIRGRIFELLLKENEILNEKLRKK